MEAYFIWDKKWERHELMEKFQSYLIEKESSSLTIQKYMSDIRRFLDFIKEKQVTKEHILLYREYLMENYAVSSVNSMLAAVNQLMECLECPQLKVKSIKCQRRFFRKENKNLKVGEYRQILKAAGRQKDPRMTMIIEAMAATGARVSELKFFTAEQIKQGKIEIFHKGKYRVILLPRALQLRLLYYMQKRNIRTGAAFCTRSGQPMNRSNIWKSMKRLGEAAGVEPEKIFPHNFRHLFATVFYKVTKNLTALADLMGHSRLDTTRIYTMEGTAEYRQSLEKMMMVFENKKSTT